MSEVWMESVSAAVMDEAAGERRTQQTQTETKTVRRSESGEN